MTITKKIKNIITISLIAGSLVVCGICALSILLPSYLSWKSYYDALVEEWNNTTTTTTTSDETDDTDDTNDVDDVENETEAASKVTLGSTTLTLDETVVRSK